MLQRCDLSLADMPDELLTKIFLATCLPTPPLGSADLRQLTMIASTCSRFKQLLESPLPVFRTLNLRASPAREVLRNVPALEPLLAWLRKGRAPAVRTLVLPPVVPAVIEQLMLELGPQLRSLDLESSLFSSLGHAGAVELCHRTCSGLCTLILRDCRPVSTWPQTVDLAPLSRLSSLCSLQVCKICITGGWGSLGSKLQNLRCLHLQQLDTASNLCSMTSMVSLREVSLHFVPSYHRKPLPDLTLLPKLCKLTIVGPITNVSLDLSKSTTLHTLNLGGLLSCASLRCNLLVLRQVLLADMCGNVSAHALLQGALTAHTEPTLPTLLSLAFQLLDFTTFDPVLSKFDGLARAVP